MAEELSLDDNLIEHYSFLVEKGHDIIRLDKFLMLRLANKSRNRIQQCIINGNVFCNNKKQVKSNYKVKPNDEISIRFEYEDLLGTWLVEQFKSFTQLLRAIL